MPNPLLKKINENYRAVHEAKENSFWENKMGHAGATPKDFTDKELQFRKFITEPSFIPQIQSAISDKTLSDSDRLGLEGWLRFFSLNSIGNEQAKEVRNKTLMLETELHKKRSDMKLGYRNPKSGEFIPAGLNKLTLLQRTNDDELTRKAAWEGIREIESFALENGYLEIVKERNRFARLLGHSDFYEYKARLFEGCSKAEIFKALDELEEVTRRPAQDSLLELQREKGESATKPWNFSYATYGDLTKKLDPYFPLSQSLSRWMRSFSALGIRYSGARLSLDLIDRKGKFDNGFMHGPVPSFQEGDHFHPARINFTTTAVPGAAGSGRTTTGVLFHEAGHAAHFSNIRMPAPCFAQEHAPTSVAFAETQSMFLDSLILDADWRVRYALDENGNPPPVELLQDSAAQSHRFHAHTLRHMMVIPYFEKALYEMRDEELTPERVLALARETEARLHFGNQGSRPLLSVPHLLGDEASAYCHGYVLALMAVYQTRDYFFRQFGHILDNPEVGPLLSEKYWRLGNHKSFFAFVHDLTGKPFSAEATAKLISKSIEDVRQHVADTIEQEKTIPRPQGPIALDAKISIVHGGDEIGSSSSCGTYEKLAERFSDWVRNLG